MMRQLSDRKEKILKAIIEDHLHFAAPVGSQHICQRFNLGFSPATVRNEMALLEKDGYIGQPHTSAGRTPTDKGYRYYVDNLMKGKGPTKKEEETINRAYESAADDLDFIAHQTIEVASSLTHYACAMLIGEKSVKERVYHFGISNIAAQPEFSDINRLKEIIKVFEEEDLLVSMLREYSEEGDIIIKIGSENKFREVRGCSVVVASCQTEDDLGTIGIIGPTRMSYNRTATILDQLIRKVRKLFGRINSGGFDERT